MPKSPGTNIDFLTHVMEFAPTGALMQGFVLEGLRIYAEQVMAATDAEWSDHCVVSLPVWKRCAKHFLDELKKRDERNKVTA